MLGYWVYMLASRPKGTLSVGVTTDLVRRVPDDREGVLPGFTEKYGVTRLVWFEPSTRSRPRSGAKNA
jgi:putative endonuclease